MSRRSLRVVDWLSVAELSKAAKKENNGHVQIRILAVRYILQRHTIPQAAQIFSLSESQMRMWVHRYNRGGLEGLRNRTRSGRLSLLAGDQLERLKDCAYRIITESENLSTLRGEDIRRLLQKKFGVTYSLSGTYALLYRLGLSSLVSRSRRPKGAQAGLKKLKEKAGQVRRDRSDKGVEVVVSS